MPAKSSLPAEFRVLYEDNHLLVVDKPAGIATMGAEAGTPTMAKLAAAYLKQKYDKPGNVFVGVVSRLDRLVSGVLVLARTSKAAARLTEQFRSHSTTKQYLAVIEPHRDFSYFLEAQVQAGSAKASSSGASIGGGQGWTRLTDWMAKDESRQRMDFVPAQSPVGQLAELEYRVLGVESKRVLLLVRLLTGRKHQIRLQLSEHCGAILGDRKYGSTTSFPQGIALHAWKLDIAHPTRSERCVFTAPVPSYWPRPAQKQIESFQGE